MPSVDHLPTLLTRGAADKASAEIIDVPTSQPSAPALPFKTGLSPNLDRLLGILVAFGEAYLTQRQAPMEARQMQTMSQPQEGMPSNFPPVPPQVVQEALRHWLPQLGAFGDMKIKDALAVYPTIETQVVGQVTAELNRILQGLQ